MKTFNRLPSGKYAVAFEFAALAGRALLSLPLLGSAMRLVGRAISRFLLLITPALAIEVLKPNSLSERPKEFYIEIWKYTFPLTIVFCTFLTGTLAWISGTLTSNSNITIPFLHDKHNLFLYLIICPAYISAAFCLIATTALSWYRLNTQSPPPNTQHRIQISNGTRLAFFVAASFMIASLFVANYIDDLSDPKKTREVYWFFQVAGSGERMLNKVGLYYLFMNAVLLYVTVVAALCYIAMAIEMLRLGANLESSSFALPAPTTTEQLEQNITSREAALRLELADFTYCYIWAKVLVLVYAVNILVWHHSPAGETSNVHAAIFVLVLIGVFAIALPGYYLGSRWHHLCIDQTEIVTKTTSDPPENYSDIRSRKLKRYAGAIDLIFYSLLVSIIYEKYDLDLNNVGGYLWEVLKRWLFPFLLW